MENKEIKEGDVVILKSGSPKMTVTSIGNSDTRCYYFYEGKVELTDVPTISLKHYSKEPSKGMLSTP